MLNAFQLYRLSFWRRLCSDSHMVHECNFLFDSFDSALAYALESVEDSLWVITSYADPTEYLARSAYV